MTNAMFNVTSLCNFLKRRNRAPYVIFADGESVTFQRNNEVLVRFAWEDIARVSTYKKDLLTTDLICLEFHLIGGASYNAHEEADGFQDLMKLMGQALPSMKPLTPCGMSLRSGDSRGTGFLFSNMLYSMLFITFYGGILPRVHYKRSCG